MAICQLSWYRQKHYNQHTDLVTLLSVPKELSPKNIWCDHLVFLYFQFLVLKDGTLMYESVIGTVVVPPIIKCVVGHTIKELVVLQLPIISELPRIRELCK